MRYIFSIPEFNNFTDNEKSREAVVITTHFEVYSFSHNKVIDTEGCGL